MEAITRKVVCPKCNAINDYTITDMKLYDSDMHISYRCDACDTEYTDVYTLGYLGGHSDSIAYVRDNLLSREWGTCLGST